VLKKKLLFVAAFFAVVTFSGCNWLNHKTDCSSCPSHSKHTYSENSLVHQIHSKAEFDKLINTATLPVVVKFGARWCSSCQEMKPILAEIAATKKNLYVVADVELTEAKELQEEFKIKGVPTIYVFRNGKEIPVSHHPTGFTPKRELLSFLSRAIDRN
jgi:thioredoxin 1